MGGTPDDSTSIQVSRVCFPVTALGPGRRVGIWFQGCHIGCVGCVSRDTWDSAGGQSRHVDDLAELVDRATFEGCSGVTISGGEPFEQSAALGALISKIRRVGAARSLELDILCYSGFSTSRLKRLHASVLAQLDGVITGPFVQALPTSFALRGSGNQELVCLSPLGAQRYGDLVAACPSRPGFQVAVDDDSVAMIGIPLRGDLDRLAEIARLRGVHLEKLSWIA